MPITQETVTHVTCDGPACPGHPYLDPASLGGWTLVQGQTYADDGTTIAATQKVFGSSQCLSNYTAGIASSGGRFA